MPELEDLPELEQLRTLDVVAALLADHADSGWLAFHNQHDPESDEFLDGLLGEIPSEDELMQLTHAFARVTDPSKPIYSCGACGIRDLNREYTVFNVLDELDLLEQQPDESAAIDAIDAQFRPAVSQWQDPRTLRRFHLHPELVDQANEQRPTTRLCSSCARALREGKRPKWSIAAGVDYGAASRLGLQPLTLPEQVVLARVRLFVTVLKLRGHSTGAARYPAIKGHAICFSQDAPEQLAAQANLIDNLATLDRSLCVAFLGSQGQLERVQMEVGRLVQVRARVLLEWIAAMRALNPRMANAFALGGDEAALEQTCAAAQERLRQAAIIDDPDSQVIDAVATDDIARIRRDADPDELPPEVCARFAPFPTPSCSIQLALLACRHHLETATGPSQR